MDMGDNTSSSNCSSDQVVEFLITSDSKLQVSGGDSLYFKVLAGVAG